ncbi:hypothetical protein BGP_2970 [Beggiatoa sp. PS]|nr:hypothetical protein BGP_2970 [Beggiatoa sp. PS]
MQDFQDKVKVKTLVLIVGFNPENPKILKILIQTIEYNESTHNPTEFVNSMFAF